MPCPVAIEKRFGFQPARRSHRHADAQTQTRRRTNTQTQRHKGIQTHRHSDTKTFRHTDTDTDVFRSSCTRAAHVCLRQPMYEDMENQEAGLAPPTQHAGTHASDPIQSERDAASAPAATRTSSPFSSGLQPARPPSHTCSGHVVLRNKPIVVAVAVKSKTKVQKSWKSGGAARCKWM